jgi:hypothetical protein
VSDPIDTSPRDWRDTWPTDVRPLTNFQMRFTSQEPQTGRTRGNADYDDDTPRYREPVCPICNYRHPPKSWACPGAF